MNKLLLIIQREYATRVMKKSFIIITLLAPLLFVAMFTVPILLTVFAGNETMEVVVKDETGLFKMPEKTSDKAVFIPSNESIETLKKEYGEKGYDGVLYIPSDALTGGEDVAVNYFSEGQISKGAKGYIERHFEDLVEKHKINQAGYDEAVMNSFRTDVDLKQVEINYDEAGNLVESDKKNTAEIATAIGFIGGMIIYIVLLLYGTMIMRSVMEEKTNRIVEVIISSVKPFHLMLGKIIGVSAVGLTQMVLWIVISTGLMAVTTLFLPEVDPVALQNSMEGMANTPPPIQESEAMGMVNTIMDQNWGYILPLFLFYFIGGYFIYASLFAAVGSAMGDDMGESQPLTFVAMVPIILAVFLLGPVIDNPTSPLATWASIFPLTSPVLMPARLAFEPPLWEVLVSLLVLAVSAWFFVWLAGRIYRVGILMYGKKVTIKEIGKWMFYRE